MNEIGSWLDPLKTPVFYEGLVRSGSAVEVTSSASAMLPRRGRLALLAEIHARLVGWDSQAMRDHGVALDEGARLDAIVDASAIARYAGSGCFVCTAVDCRSNSGARARTVLTVTNYGSALEPLWLIHP